MAEQRMDSGALFRNEYKQAGDKRPDYKGPLETLCPHCNVVTVRDLAGWLTTTREGKRYMSIKAGPKREAPPPAPPPPPQAPPPPPPFRGGDDQHIPF